MAPGALNPTSLESIIVDEFQEMPGLRLTMPQVCRLWSLTQTTAETVVRSLVTRGFLTLDRCGCVCRPEEGIPARARAGRVR